MGRGGYGNVEFWDDYYVSDRPEPYDWFFSALHLAPLLKEVLDPSDNILMVGCGNAPFSEELHAQGFDQLVNCDNCESVVVKMRERSPHMVWHVEDVRSMTYPSEHFDVIFDKGLLDNLYCYKDPEEHCEQAVADMYRVLKPGGFFVVLSCHDAEEVEGSLRCNPERRWGDGPGSRLLLRLRNPRFPSTRVACYTMLCLVKAPPPSAPPSPGAAAAAAETGGPTAPATSALSRPSRLPSDPVALSALASLVSPEDGGPLVLRDEQIADIRRQIEELNEKSRREMRERQEALRTQLQQQQQQQQQQRQQHPLAAEDTDTRGETDAATPSPPNGTFSQQLSLRRLSLRPTPPLAPAQVPPRAEEGTASAPGPADQPETSSQERDE